MSWILTFHSQTIIRGHNQQNGHSHNVSLARSNSLRGESPPPYRARPPGNDYPPVPEDEMMRNVPRADYPQQQQQQHQNYHPQQQPGYPSHQQQQQGYPQQYPNNYRDQPDTHGDFGPRDRGMHPPQDRHDPRMPGGNFHDGHSSLDRRRGDFHPTPMERKHPPMQHDYDRRANNSYDGHPRGDNSFDQRSPPPGPDHSQRHSHYDDRSLPNQSNDRYRQMTNGANQNQAPRHQSIPPANHDSPNYASISRTPGALQYERVSI